MNQLFLTLYLVIALAGCQSLIKKEAKNGFTSSADFFDKANTSLPCQSAQGSFAAIVHGGAGNWNKISDTKKQIMIESTKSILNQARAALQRGASALAVTEMVIALMESSGKFNAGKGAIKNRDGEVELDASIMDGSNMKSGAVAAIKLIANPIVGARMVMEQSPHRLIVGPGAVNFLSSHDIPTVDQNYFQSFYESKGLGTTQEMIGKKYGTVGAAILDQCGNLASGTSTGGWTSKIPGRVGDSPLIGAGTYANKDVAISSTGHGEFLMAYSAAFNIATHYKNTKGKNLQRAVENVVIDLKKVGGAAGFIAVDKKGNIAEGFNTKGMLRGMVTKKREPSVEI